jgi:phosphonate transport system substrate-binding protein
MSGFFRTALVLGSILATLVAQAPQPPAAQKLTLGIYSFKKRSEVWKQFQPVAVELSRLMTAELGKPIAIELIVPETYEESLEQFIAGKIDIVRFGPASYVLAKQRSPGVHLLAAEREDSRNVGLIVVRADSPITKLADLKGKKFAFGDSQSTIGRYLSQAELAHAGVLERDLAAHTFLERHDNVFKSVEIGDHDAGALHVDTFQDLNEKAARKLRILHSFDNAPKAWLAGQALPPELAKALTSCLVKMKDPAALKALKVPGFTPTADEEYDAVRDGMEKAERFAPTKSTPIPAKPAAPAPAPAPQKG